MRTFPKSVFPAGELNSISKTFLTLYKESSISDEFFNEVIPLLEEANQQLSTLLIKSVNTELNDKLSKADHIRDAAFIAFRDYCRVFENYHIPHKAKAARKITDQIRVYGWKMNKIGYSEENKSLNQLIIDLEEPKYKAAIAIIGAESMFYGLKKTQKEFEILYNQEVSDINAADYPEIREAKKNLEDYLEALVSYTCIKAELHSTKYGALYDKVLNLINETAEEILLKSNQKSTV